MKPNRHRYRAWNPRNKEMMELTGFTIRDDGTVNSIIFKNGFETCIQDGDVILMQSTGLADKNDVEIFEGDIIKTNWHPLSVGRFNIGVVTFGVYEGHDDWGSDNTGFYSRVSDCNIVELPNFHGMRVLGSIYQNPELIK